VWKLLEKWPLGRTRQRIMLKLISELGYGDMDSIEVTRDKFQG
jgi:hypothetical protein